MEARILRVAIVIAAFAGLGASHRTPNFIITAPTAEFAKQVGDAAETYRKELAVLWLGHELPRWAEPCPIVLQVGPNLGAGGATSFVFDRGEVFGWNMNIQGSPERLLDSVLPHEVTHTIFASHFRRPLPRWADEGACTTVEHEVERRKQQQMLVQFLKTGRGIPFSKMFLMRDYPADVMPLYSQGYSLCRYLIQQGGRKKFVDFVADGMKNENWTAVTKQYYGYGNLGELQTAWVDWVKNGSPPLDLPETPSAEDPLIAQNEPLERPSQDPIFRAQSADPPPAATLPAAHTSIASAEAPRREGRAMPVATRQSATLSYPRDADLALAQSAAAEASSPSPAATPPSPASQTPTSPPVSQIDPAHLPGPATSGPAPMANPSTAPAPRQKLLEWSREPAVDEQGRPLPPPPTRPNPTPRAASAPTPAQLMADNPFASEMTLR